MELREWVSKDELKVYASTGDASSTIAETTGASFTSSTPFTDFSAKASAALAVLTSLSFVVGSVCFYPNLDHDCGQIESCPFVGALLFVIGSCFLFINGCITLCKSGELSLKNKGTLLYGSMQLLSSAMFIIGDDIHV